MHNFSYIINVADRSKPGTEQSALAARLRQVWADRGRREPLSDSVRQRVLGLLFDPAGPDWAAQVEDLFTGWEVDWGTDLEDAGRSEQPINGPDLTDLVRMGIDRFGIDPQSVYAQAAFLSALLGETQTPLKFHNPAHHRKVLFHGLRLIEENNRLFADEPRCTLAPEEAALTMAAICIHDLMHDGQGNGHGDAYVPGRLEQRAFDFARPWLHAAGLDTEDLLDLEAILLTTEVTPIGSPAAPAQQMRDAYAFHFQDSLSCELSGKLTRLQSRRDLARIGLLVHAADIASSAGVSESLSRHETALFLKESGVESPLLDVLPAFLEGVGTALAQFEPACSLYNPCRLHILKNCVHTTQL